MKIINDIREDLGFYIILGIMLIAVFGGPFVGAHLDNIAHAEAQTQVQTQPKVPSIPISSDRVFKAVNVLEIAAQEYRGTLKEHKALSDALQTIRGYVEQTEQAKRVEKLKLNEKTP